MSRIGRLERRWTRVGNVRVHVRVSVDAAPGGRPPVVLVHGMVISGSYLVPTAERLAPEFRVYVPDLPGYGRSDKPRRTADVPGMAEALAAWMAAEGLDRAAFLGNSLGCQVIAELAVRHPDRVTCAILQGPTIDPHAHSHGRQLWRFLVNSSRERGGPGRLMVRDYLAAGPRRIVATYRAAMAHRIETLLPRMTVPTLVVRGSRDAIVSQVWAEEAARLLPRGRLAVVPGAAHAINYSAPDKLVRVARPFLRGQLP